MAPGIQADNAISGTSFSRVFFIISRSLQV
jgi:hypothetical protein